MSQVSGLQEETATASWVREQLIFLHRLNGQEIGVNSDLIERAEATPDVTSQVPAAWLGGSQGPVVKSWRRTSSRLRLWLAAVWM